VAKISTIFNLNATQGELDFVDISTSRDTRLFVEPFAISLRNDVWSEHCQDHLTSFFDAVVQAIRSNNDSRALGFLNYLAEPDETGLGYSKTRGRGRGVKGEKAQSLLLALKKSRAVQTGLLKDLGEADLFVEGISLDGLSDLAPNVLRGPLIDYTQAQCTNWDIPLRKNVAVGHVWDTAQQQWHIKYADLPVAEDRHVILVPKFSVRRSLLLNSQEYYNKYILDFIKSEEIRRGSGLVHVLKNGKRTVYKSEIKPLNPFSKDFLARFSADNPQVLDSYKRIYEDLPDADGAPRNSDIDKDFNESAFAKALIERLPNIPGGTENATVYHRFMIGLLEFLFYPNLIYPVAEQKLHDGRKRIDIMYTNSAKSGFFERAIKSKQLQSQSIPIECKNYTKDPANPEVDQISGRFGHSRGWLGFMCYRSSSNDKHLLKRCSDTALDGRGYIIPLSDSDVLQMLSLVAEFKRADIDEWLSKRLAIITGNA
jgi:hypothetical protein